MRHAREAGAALEVVEWPGGPAVEIESAVDESALAALRRGTKTMPLLASVVDDGAALPLGSIVTVRTADAEQRVLVDSVMYRRGWHLKVFTSVAREDTLAKLQADSARLRREFGMLERTS